MNDDNATGSILIYNIMGKLVRNQSLSGKKSIIDRNGLANGIYFLRMISQNMNVLLTEKIIVY
jgi:hypothetical protein